MNEVNWTWMNLKKWEFDTPSLKQNNNEEKLDEKENLKEKNDDDDERENDRRKKKQEDEGRKNVIYTPHYLAMVLLAIYRRNLAAAIIPWLYSPVVKFFTLFSY